MVNVMRWLAPAADQMSCGRSGYLAMRITDDPCSCRRLCYAFGANRAYVSGLIYRNELWYRSYRVTWPDDDLGQGHPVAS